MAIEKSSLTRIFPFFLEVAPSLQIVCVGELMARVCPEAVEGAKLHECFATQGSGCRADDFTSLVDSARRTVLLTRLVAATRVFKGEWLLDAESGSAYFLGWPWIMDSQQLPEWGFSLAEIPAHNPLGDLLLLLRSNQNTLADTRELAQRLRQRTEALEAANHTLDHQATHDPLTGLPNRLLLRDRLNHAMLAATRDEVILGVLFIDLDHFKQINDSLGHRVGDAVLVEAARRIEAELRTCDTVAREGGDEFVVLLEGLGGADDASIVAAKILASLGRSFADSGRQLHFSASIGIALFPHDGVEAEQLIQRADVALYEAKQDGRARFHFCTPEVHARVLRRYSIEEQLRRAVEHEEFELHFQPQIDISGGGLVGAEALVRWRHPERGLLFPDEFIDIAEESGLIEPIGKWVLREACRQGSRWMNGGTALHVAVNVSPRQLKRGELELTVRSALDDSGFDPALLMLELTEGSVMSDPASARRQLVRFKAAGVRLALDDFGTGYANLRTLSSLPFDIVKIDRGFMADVPARRESMAIILAILNLATHLDLSVVAEGVENQVQHAFLRDHGCRHAQGYWYSRPIAADAMAVLVASQAGLVPAHDD